MDESIAAQADDLDVLQVGSSVANETIESAAMVREPFLWRGYIAATLVCALELVRQPDLYAGDDGAALRDIVFSWWEANFMMKP